MSHHNEMEVRFLSLPENEAFARVVIAAFAVQLSPTVSEIADINLNPYNLCLQSI